MSQLDDTDARSRENRRRIEAIERVLAELCERAGIAPPTDAARREARLFDAFRGSESTVLMSATPPADSGAAQTGAAKCDHTLDEFACDKPKGHRGQCRMAARQRHKWVDGKCQLCGAGAGASSLEFCTEAKR